MATTRVTDRAGQVLGGRYRLVASIGTGASASVYVADDLTLRRRVAIKVLHDALADDEAFLRRFQAEAHAAAALNHPHVLSVFDWSHGGGGEVAYLVMEFLSGGSLKAVLDGGYLLTPSQALLVGLEAARGLDYAHRRGFVHRDVKPANLLFDDEARLRIADFGLARALAEAAWTEPMGAVLGTARYASPEQAQGDLLDGRSDVYSLALVIIEAVTGVVPFAADTTLGTLMARVGKPLPVPEELGPLSSIVAAAGAADPKDRIGADELGQGLLEVAEQLDPPEPLPLVHAPVESVDRPGPGATAAGVPAAVATPDELADDITAVFGVAGAGPVVAGAVAAGGAVGAALADTDHQGVVLTPPEATDVAPALTRAERRAARRQAKAVGKDADSHADASGSATLVETAVRAEPAVFDYADDSDLGLGSNGNGSGKGRGADGGDGGAQSDRARRASAKRDRSGPRKIRRRASVEPGIGSEDVAGSDRDDRRTRPSTRTRVPTRRRRRRRWLAIGLVLVVLAGVAGGGYAYYDHRWPEVPALVGTTAEQATSIIDQQGWEVQTTDRYQAGTDPGDVLEQVPPPGERLDRSEAISLVVSLGAEPVAVPSDLAGMSLDDATAALERAGLELGDVARFYDEEVPVDHVMAPGLGTPSEAVPGTPIALIVSDGPEPRTVPDDLAGRSRSEVIDQLEAMDLEVVVSEQYNDDIHEGLVFWVDPVAGEKVPKGGTVRIGVSLGPELVVVPDVAGMSVLTAADALEAAGLLVQGTTGSPTRLVVSTTPAAGQSVRKGSGVTIITSTG